MNLRRILKGGDPWIWLTGGSVAISLLMIAGLLLLVTTKSLGFFWPTDIIELKLKDGTAALGQIRNRETIPDGSASSATGERTQLQVGNRELYGADFRWIDADDVTSSSNPADAVVLERREWGNFYGFVKELWSGETLIASGPQAGWTALHERLPAAQDLAVEQRKLETSEATSINYSLDLERLRRARAIRAGESAETLRAIDAREAELHRQHDALQNKMAELGAKTQIDRVVMLDVGGQEKQIPLSQIVHAYQPNAMSVAAKSLLYTAKLWEFVADDPRESNTEGGIFPAIFGTVMMVMLMSIAVVPFGVLTAIRTMRTSTPCLAYSRR